MGSADVRSAASENRHVNVKTAGQLLVAGPNDSDKFALYMIQAGWNRTSYMCIDTVVASAHELQWLTIPPGNNIAGPSYFTPMRVHVVMRSKGMLHRSSVTDTFMID